jgi:hypothetical protein
VVKSRIIRGVGHAARVGEMKNTNFCLEKLNGTDDLEDLGVEGRIISELIIV